VWHALTEIPYGETTSYGEIARRVGRPGAARAVGLANGQNPVAIIVPCHRVIGADGSLTGYGGGLDAKRVLLQLERDHDTPRLALHALTGAVAGRHALTGAVAGPVRSAGRRRLAQPAP
jgi:methylated-DNA-[protein]-cysteine S-methyltransferase